MKKPHCRRAVRGAAAVFYLCLVPLVDAAAPLLTLSNGVQMPVVACGTGGDSNTSAQVTVAAAFSAGFTHIDTAADYDDQGGVGVAIKAFERKELFLTTKIPGCGVPTQGLPPPCFNNSARKIDDDLALLDTPYVDLLLIHFPPILGCIPANCKHMQQQWAALELAYESGKAKAIGVSNYCEACVQCLLKVSKVTPMVNQVQYHIGMGAGYPEATPGFWARQNITIMAYSPLGGGKRGVLDPHSSFAPLGKSLGLKYNVSAAQIALGWIGQHAEFSPTGPMALVTKSTNLTYLKQDLDLWSWELSSEDRETLDKVADPACAEEAPGGCCKMEGDGNDRGAHVHNGAGQIRLLHGSGFLPESTFVPYWGRYAAPGKRIGMILNGNGGLAQGEAAFASRRTQMSTAMGGIPHENFVFVPLFGDLCPTMANDPAVAALIASCDAVYMPGGNQGLLAACIYGVVSDSGVDSPEDTLSVIALRTVAMVGGDSAGAMTQPSAPMMSRHDEDWTSCFPCDMCCGESYCALTNGCVFTRDTGNKLVDDKMMIHTHVAER